MYCGFLCVGWFVGKRRRSVFGDSNPFLQKKETVCHSSSSYCGRAQLTCQAGQRLAILGVSRAYHLNISTFDQCASTSPNCSAIPEGCCQHLDSPVTCKEDYSEELIEEAYGNCSAQLARSGQENVSCALEFPADPEPETGRCRRLSVYRSRSSYSVVDYACIPETDVAQFCKTSQRKGNLLYAIWTVGDSTSYLSDVNVTSCRCSVTVNPASPSDIFVRALDVRIPRSDVREKCSYVTITDGVTSRLNTTCGNKTTIVFDSSSSSQFSGVTPSKPPVDVLLSVHPKNVPDIVWVGFKGFDSRDLTLTCFEAGHNLTRPTPNATETVNMTDDSLPAAPAIIGGVVAALVFVVILGFICFHFVSKRKRTSQDCTKAPSWWERTRQEDRLADLSQLGPASHVNVDRGRHMGYGKHPPTRRSYPTSDTNPPLYFVSGSAVAQDPDLVGDGDRVANSRRTSAMNGLHPDMRRASGTVSSNMAGGGGEGGLGEPGVRYTAAAAAKGGGEEPQSVVIVNDGSKVRVYEIPPLTVKEIE